MTKKNKLWRASTRPIDALSERVIRDLENYVPKNETPVLLVWYGVLHRTFLLFTTRRMWYGKRDPGCHVSLSLTDHVRFNRRVSFLHKLYTPAVIQDLHTYNNHVVVRRHFQRK